ncbi:hypothetical protein BDZ94DRAFT_1267057 [Collybia nuda]|uniref:Uncharacterized protein n=1 Tax=Collybia nuda TaxID=64659 RepID=A0A9P5Y0E7_9AGAR|nr:hypothetical protein BDZ94DRAFT_1267057 [Collybia nuda]
MCVPHRVATLRIDFKTDIIHPFHYVGQIGDQTEYHGYFHSTEVFRNTPLSVPLYFES